VKEKAKTMQYVPSTFAENRHNF